MFYNENESIFGEKEMGKNEALLTSELEVIFIENSLQSFTKIVNSRHDNFILTFALRKHERSSLIAYFMKLTINKSKVVSNNVIIKFSN